MISFGDFLESTPTQQIILVSLTGLVTALTPCVYPLIPITLSLFGATSQKSYARAFMLSCAYVLGIALTYTLLGVVSALSGFLFGSILGNPWCASLLAIFLFILALFSLDLVPLSAAARLQNFAARIGGKGVLGAFMMGSVSGLVAAPCVGPILVIVLGIAAKSASIKWGALLLFCYSLGLGFPFLLLGTFSGLIQKLPKAGSWLNIIKYLTALALLVVAIRLVWPFVPESLLSIYIVSAKVLSIAWTILLALAYVAYRFDLHKLKFLSALLFALTLSPSITPTRFQTDLQWLPNMREALALGAKENRYTMVDLYADWCAACLELDQKTFSDPKVTSTLNDLVLARIDFTQGDAESERIQKEYDVLGLPCVMFFAPDGHELADSRITGAMPPEAFLKHLEGIRNPR